MEAHARLTAPKICAVSDRLSCGFAAQVLHTALDWLQRERATSELSIMMVVGLPNSGKSSLINAFKLSSKKQGALGGATGGVQQPACRQQHSRVMSDQQQQSTHATQNVRAHADGDLHAC